MISIALRLPNNITHRLNKIATETGQSRNSLIIALLDQATQRTDDLSPDLVLGYVQLTGSTPEIDCPECSQPLTQPHIGFTAGVHQPQSFGPVCHHCANLDKSI